MLHADIKVYGIVQGVGFRPFIHKQISQYFLTGRIRNTSDGAEIEIEGESENVRRFVSELWTKSPKLALIEDVKADFSGEIKGFKDFKIIESQAYDARNTLISPDICICNDCLHELFYSKDRRYKYPFINCTNCGPRFTIIKDIPYDRCNTTMAPFKMCADCETEYKDIENRRYHAQPDCCAECGPEVFFVENDIRSKDEISLYSKDRGADKKNFEAGLTVSECKIRKYKSYENKHNDGNIKSIEKAKSYLAAGKIIAVKGIGGIHLACRCDDAELVKLLRKRKQRDEKPFALMAKNVETAEKICFANDTEKAALTSEKRPIVLLEKKDKTAWLHISENNYIGIMLPYTPLHYLLFDDAGYDMLVMTSANISDKPIITKNEDALRELKDVADGFLLNNREIETACDDSLIWIVDGKEYPVRRSRGYVPMPIKVESLKSNFARIKSDGKVDTDNFLKNIDKNDKSDVGQYSLIGEIPDISKKGNNIIKKKRIHILACGAEQKATFALLKGNYVFQSQHIGDLKNAETFENYCMQIEHFKKMFSITPQVVVCDMHPDYLSTEYAENYRNYDKVANEVKDVNSHQATKADNEIDLDKEKKKKNDSDELQILKVFDEKNEADIKYIKVQHHHAHMASCMADNGLNEKCIGIIWDGTGLGTDGSIWGGEFLVGDYASVERAGSIMPFRLPGGDKASRELYRSAISVVKEALGYFESEDGMLEGYRNIAEPYDEDKILANSICKILNIDEEKFEQINFMLENDLNCPTCTSMGRLFDAAAAILGIKSKASYEGQGAILLEAAGTRYAEKCGRYAEEKADIQKQECILKSKPNTEIKEEFVKGNRESVSISKNIFSYNIEKSEDGRYIFDFRPMIREMLSGVIETKTEISSTDNQLAIMEIAVNEIQRSDDKNTTGKYALMFMDTLVDMAANIAKLIRKDTGLEAVVLSGGTFQNQYILKELKKRLAADGFRVYTHNRVSTNDEGIAFGQIAVAAAQLTYLHDTNT